MLYGYLISNTSNAKIGPLFIPRLVNDATHLISELHHPGWPSKANYDVYPCSSKFSGNY